MKSSAQRAALLSVAMGLLLDASRALAFAQRYHGYEDAQLVVQRTIDDLDLVINRDPELDKGRGRVRINRATYWVGTRRTD